MKRRKHKNLLHKKSKKSYKCDSCFNVFPTITAFQKHALQNMECKRNLPYSCEFCSYVGYDPLGFQRHIQYRPSCAQFYKEKEVTTGQIIDFSSRKIFNNESDKNQVSYHYKRFSASGIQDTVQLNVPNDPFSNMNFNKQIDHLEKLKDSSTQCLAYMHSGRLFSSFLQETLPFNFISNNDEQGNNLHPEIINDEYEQERNIQDHTVINDETIPWQNPSGTIDITKEQDDIMRRFSEASFTHTEEACIDLFHILKTSNVPLIMFDRIIRWLKRHDSTISTYGVTGILKRDQFIESMNQKLYSNSASIMKPKIHQTMLSSGRTTNVVTFSITEMILRMVTNKSIFHPDNLLLDPTNPCGDVIDDGYYGDVNTGTWYTDAKRRECSLPNHILMPFCHFIDGLTVDKYGKLSVEAVLSCCLWFNRKARNRSSTWFVQGFIEDQSLFRDQKNYIRTEKLQDYHDMMSKIFEEMKNIRNNGGIKLTLDFGNHGIHEVIAIPVIQFIIGDCKGNDTLCGRKGGHSVTMKGLCRDCDISPENSDKTCIDSPLLCQFITKNDVEGKDKEELDQISFIPIHNCFSKLSFGGDPRGVYGGTPAEILHAVLLGLCDYISEGIELMFTQTCMELISHVVAGIYKDGKRQSERTLPNISPFRNGLNTVAKLKAKERYARIFVLFMALSNSYLIKILCSKRKKRQDDNETPPMINRIFLLKLYIVLTETLMFHMWLKKEKYDKTDFITLPGTSDSKASRRIKTYLQNFKEVIKRGGNGLKTPKFHQMLHVCDYIKRHGSPLNYDGSRGENFGKIKIKDNAKLTRKQKGAFNFDIGRRISEEDVIDTASIVFQRNRGYWPSEFCNDTDIDLSAKRFQNETLRNQINKNDLKDKGRYKLVCSVESNENDNTIAEEVNVHIDWGGQSRTPVRSYPQDLLKTVAARLYIGSPNIGGKISNPSIIHGYTEVSIGDNIYRCHPFYANTGHWFDWANFRWEGYESYVPARLLMILDLTDCEINYEADIDQDELTKITYVSTIPHLTNEKWAVVNAAESPETICSELTDDHFFSDITTRFKIDQNRVWLVPLSALVGPCFVIENKNYCEDKGDDSIEQDDSAYVIKPTNMWSESFLI